MSKAADIESAKRWINNTHSSNGEARALMALRHHQSPAAIVSAVGGVHNSHNAASIGSDGRATKRLLSKAVVGLGQDVVKASGIDAEAAQSLMASLRSSDYGRALQELDTAFPSSRDAGMTLPQEVETLRNALTRIVNAPSRIARA